ncbi:MAG: potassium transporter [Hyphomonas sp.]|uniref:monovalent cation:proton antiporter-2 (CPA2) family protein n=1 Tax=Hyphomonas sp. TaxID=87 RepID=UPI0017C89613|nr:monovalent cation:proton antiporter-2 (CPA2) family protein [Hyphomonas sp.]MBA3070508.1 potassium transporter [Hyphomonas sp.]MBU4062038.1 monovalent cation:proton antiporter-2 (CPA2) family protein [Alphaproteobacteria bacterium]MBU4164974.1 monovalent cation:proton antiporter-2 (CPA2) family protein [Alphaproteobacteria bacterium]
MAVESHGPDLGAIVVLLGSAVLAVPLFKRIGFGSVLGYLAAGLVIGPFGFRVFTEPEAILHVAELGVVMFLFIIGLEMQPSRLWSMRKEIFGLGLAQVLVCILLLSWVGVALGYTPQQSLIAGTGFVLTSTAIVMQMLQERGDLAKQKGQRIVSILLLEDLAIVPLLALVAFLAPGGGEVSITERLRGVAIGIGAIAALVVAGRYLLNPVFRLLAAARAREVMTAAALLIVLGAAWGMQLGGLSTAMGAFLAGVLLSESSYRHELEADVEPFRGILLGLFFLAVGMSLDLNVVARNWQLIALSVIAFTLLKAAGVYGVARLFRASHREAAERTVLMTQGGEFAFVLYAAALGVGLIDAEGSAVLTAIIIVSMVMTPLMVAIHDRLMPEVVVDETGMETPKDAVGTALLIGFGRFGQVVSQPLLSRGYSVTTIDNDPEMIRVAASFGFKVYFGDGARLDILHAAGAGNASLILVCVDDRAAATRMVELVRHEFPNALLLARAYDREHGLELVKAGVDYPVRETFESAIKFARAALDRLGEPEDAIDDAIAELRRRDEERFALQLTGGMMAGRELMIGNGGAEKPKDVDPPELKPDESTIGG